LSFAEAATLPIAYVTAAYSLRHLAGIRPGISVLIHAATGGVGLAALQVARAAGAEVFATAGSDVKRDYLRSLGVEHVYDSRSTGFAASIREETGGAGVDIVLNSLTGELIPESLAALRDGGCFLEIGKRGIWTAEEVAALGRDIDYHPIYVGAVTESDPSLIGNILREICAEVESRTLAPLPLRSYPFERLADAFRIMAQTRHIGKVVVTQPEHAGLRDVPDIREDATYLVTGGLGGVGLEVARWLAARGARYIALAGRREPNDAARQTIAELEETGVHILVLQGDVGQSADVARMVAAIDTAMAPLAGVIHAAGAIDDSVLAHQTWTRFEGVLSPKLNGAWNLHTATIGHRLDFFVMFSAGAALIGAPGQSNYAAANTAIDALAWWRSERGLPAVSINWGPWSEVGMAASLGDEHRRRLAQQGFHSLSTAQGLRGLDAAMHALAAQVAVLPVDWERFADGFAPDAPPSLFRDIAIVRSASQDTRQTPSRSVADQIIATSPSLRRNMMMRHVREQAAHVLGLPNSDAIPTGRPLSDMGMDSLMAVELRNVLGRSMDLLLPATLLFDCPTPDALTDYLLSALPGLDTSDKSVDVASNDRFENEIDVSALTEDEAEALLALELSRH
jgi:NADPH:quinone reductase-like Zn-dependent oxidoreductase